MPVANQSSLPGHGLLRLRQIVGDKNSVPPVPPLFPVSRSTWLAGVKDGRYPKPVKISKNLVAWRAEDIRALLEKTTAKDEPCTN